MRGFAMSIVAPKGRKHLSADALFRLVRSGFTNIPDYRPGDPDISLTDALIALSTAFLKNGHKAYPYSYNWLREQPCIAESGMQTSLR
jgi:hypothetical protein